MILYLHGFRSSPDSFKARLLAARLAELGRASEWYCPMLPVSPFDAVALIECEVARRLGPRGFSARSGGGGREVSPWSGQPEPPGQAGGLYASHALAERSSRGPAFTASSYVSHASTEVSASAFVPASTASALTGVPAGAWTGGLASAPENALAHRVRANTPMNDVPADVLANIPANGTPANALMGTASANASTGAAPAGALTADISAVVPASGAPARARGSGASANGVPTNALIGTESANASMGTAPAGALTNDVSTIAPASGAPARARGNGASANGPANGVPANALMGTASANASMGVAPAGALTNGVSAVVPANGTPARARGNGASANAPASGVPATAPASAASTTDASATKVSTTKVPATKAPATEAPATEAPVAAAPVTVIGSSLGGYYATYLAEKHGWRAVLLNPAVAPQRDLSAYLGAQPLWHGGGSIVVEPRHLDELRALGVASVTRPGRYYLVAATGDEVLDYREMLAHYPRARTRLIDGSDHGISEFADYVDDVIAFCDAPCQACAE